MKVGDISPNFILKDENGNEFELYKNLGRNILLVFYPEDNTLVCSAQLNDYNNHIDEFIKAGINIVGISTNSIQSHSIFCNKLKLNFHLLSDENKIVSRQFNALNMFGINKRMLVLIGIDKKVVWIKSSFSFIFVKSTSLLKKIQQN